MDNIGSSLTVESLGQIFEHSGTIVITELWPQRVQRLVVDITASLFIGRYTISVNINLDNQIKNLKNFHHNKKKNF